MMLSSNPVYLSNNNSNFLQIIQITDLHLFDNPNERYNGIDTKASLDCVMTKVLNDFPNADMFAITGDLLQNPTFDNYSHLFDYFDSFNKPFVPVAGNHDVNMELDYHLPFFQRRHVAVKADERLKNCYQVQSDFWNLFFLDSSCQGHIAGCFSNRTLATLVEMLQQSDKPCVVFCHHPMFRIGSAWIDNHYLKNSSVFWERILPFLHKIKGIFVGHVHQEFSDVIHGIPVYTSPSTSAQFKPKQDDFTIDDKPAGFRWIQLYHDATLSTGVCRIDKMPTTLD